jgi:hypothetical protein
VDAGWCGRLAGQHGDVAMKQFKSYRPTPPARRPRPESTVSKILWFTVEHAVGILVVIILLILWRLFMV